MGLFNIKSLRRLRWLFLALVFGAVQLLPVTYFSQVAKAAGTITISDHEGQLNPSGTYSNGNIKTYQESDPINFRFTVASTSNETGTIDVEFAGQRSKCLFFEDEFTLGTHDSSAPIVENISGLSPAVSLVGLPIADGNVWVQTVEFDFSSGAGSARINYYLTLSDEAGTCTGSSTHTSFGDNGGAVGNTGSQEVSVPSNDVIELATITATKYIDDDGDGSVDRTAGDGEWSFKLDGGSFMPTDANGQVIFSGLDTGTYIVTEQNDSDYDFLGVNGDYCVLSATPFSGDATVEASTSSPQDASCDFANGLIQDATLTLVKTVINDDGGTLTQADFPVFIGGDAASWGSNTVDADTYNVSETEQSGYLAGDWGGDCDAQGNVTLAPGETKTCTITNNDIAPTLKLIKSVTNDNGGQAEPGNWDLTARRLCFIGDSDPTCGFTDQGGSTTFHTLMANRPYALTENNGPDGYEMKGWQCDGGSFNNGKLTLGLADEITCTITNDDIAPTLKLVKVVTNDNGGTATAADWDLTARRLCPAGSTDLTCGFTDAGNADTFHELRANMPYLLTESGPSGYTAGEWSCDGGSWNNGKLTLGLDEDVTCTITNDDIVGGLTLLKELANNGYWLLNVNATDWLLKASQGTTTALSGTTGVSGDVNAGTYDLSETGPEEGFYNEGWVCRRTDLVERTLTLLGVVPNTTVSVGLGEQWECVITNTVEESPKLELAKSNDAPIAKRVGDIVTYTLTLHNPSQYIILTHPKVTDTPPEGFKYIAGSWTATSDDSSNRANLDLKNAGIAVEPTYASPGVWTFDGSCGGDVIYPGETITLTYQTIIESLVSPGVYPDLAFAKAVARSFINGLELASISREISTEIVYSNLYKKDDPFVGTEVAIIEDLPTSTYTLVETGASSVLSALIGSTMVLGALILYVYPKVRKETK